MFDHLLPKTLHQNRRVRARDRLFVTGFVVLSILIVGAVNAQINGLLSPKSEAPEPVTSVRVRTADSGDTTLLVPPLQQFPLATLFVEVADAPARLSAITILLDGTYDPAELDGLRLYYEQAQVGEPEWPDQYGRVGFDLNGMELNPGLHTLVIALDVRRVTETTILSPVLEESGIMLAQEQGALRRIVTARSNLYTFADRGVLGAFARPVDALGQGRTRLSVFSRGEDVAIREMVVQSDQVRSGSRLDLFSEGRYIATGVWADRSARFEIPQGELHARIDRVLTLDILLSGTAPSQDMRLLDARLVSVSGLGVQSGSAVHSDFSLEMHL